MLCRLIRISRKIRQLTQRAITALIDKLSRRIRELWRAHRENVGSNTAYAAATAAVIGGALGFVPVRDVLGAVLAAALGVYLHGTRKSSPAVDRWADPWETAM